MEWKDRNRAANAGEDTDRIDIEAPGYSVLRQGGGGIKLDALLRTPLVTVVLIVVVLLLTGLTLLRTGGADASKSAERFTRLESQIAGIEQRLEQMASQPAGGEDAKGMQRQIDDLVKRLDGTEAALAQRMAAVERSVKAPAPVAVAPKSSTPADAVPKASASTQPASLYTVKAGDTLYSISRRTNLTVEALRRLNQLKPGENIHPGDQLKIAP